MAPLSCGSPRRRIMVPADMLKSWNTVGGIGSLALGVYLLSLDLPVS